MRSKYFVILILLESLSCDDSKFICRSGRLINFNEICNGISECFDNSDENKDLCYRNLCQSNYFRCYYGACIQRGKLCNGVSDCIDGSDEIQCNKNRNGCRKPMFRCLSGQCISPELICNKNMDCGDGSDESLNICDHELCPIETFRCSFGGCVSKISVNDGKYDCLDGSDEFQRKRKCSSLKASIRLVLRCEFQKKIISCNQLHVPGTFARFSCPEYYVPENSKHNGNSFSVCQNNGIWSRTILKCVPDCGRIDSVIPLIVRGVRVSNIFPWHATVLYYSDQKWNIWCGGTLISEYAVLTAAHCVYGMDNPNRLLIDLGDTTVKVLKIITHPLYIDRAGNYGSDLAIVLLNRKLKLSQNILPICIDWNISDSSSLLKSGSFGYVIGKGITENSSLSKYLKIIKIPIVTYNECKRNQNFDFHKFLSISSFCAGWGNGTSVCNGDSGGGLVFLMDNKEQYSLQGVVSLSPRQQSTLFCDPFKYSIFTKINIYLNWLKGFLEFYDNKIGV